MSEQAIELQGVTKRFGQQIVVDHLDLTVPRGSIYGFIGPNGSGKTTTLRMILRIFRPDQGRVVVLGDPQGGVADNRLGYLPEERGLYKRMKVRHLLSYYARLKGHYHCRADIEHWLSRLDATSWADKKIDALSKGMAQKIQFIAAVIARPELVILDEPFSGLDPVNMEALKEAILDLRRQGTTVVFSTHDMAMAERMCDTIFMIFRGHKVLDGTLDAIQAQYPADRVRVQLDDPNAELPPLPKVEDIRRHGRYFEFRVQNQQHAQIVLKELAANVAISYFQIVKPSLHDIFVRIARPAAESDQRFQSNGNLS